MTDARRVVLRLEGGLPRELSPNARVSWPVLHSIKRRVVRDIAILARAQWPGPPAGKVSVLPRFTFPQQRVRDRDNFTAMLKAPIDGLKGIVVDDDDAEHLYLEPVLFVRGPLGLELEITEVLDG